MIFFLLDIGINQQTEEYWEKFCFLCELAKLAAQRRLSTRYRNSIPVIKTIREELGKIIRGNQAPIVDEEKKNLIVDHFLFAQIKELDEYKRCGELLISK